MCRSMSLTLAAPHLYESAHALVEVIQAPKITDLPGLDNATSST